MGRSRGRRPEDGHESLSAARQLDATLTALADPVRRRAVELIGEQPRKAGDLAHVLGLTAPTMSRHLRILKQGGLVEETHPDYDARVRIYTLKTGAMDEIKTWLAQTEAMWAGQLAAFKAHLEKGEN